MNKEESNTHDRNSLEKRSPGEKMGKGMKENTQRSGQQLQTPLLIVICDNEVNLVCIEKEGLHHTIRKNTRDSEEKVEGCEKYKEKKKKILK